MLAIQHQASWACASFPSQGLRDIENADRVIGQRAITAILLLAITDQSSSIVACGIVLVPMSGDELWRIFEIVENIRELFGLSFSSSRDLANARAQLCNVPHSEHATRLATPGDLIDLFFHVTMRQPNAPRFDPEASSIAELYSQQLTNCATLSQAFSCFVLGNTMLRSEWADRGRLCFSAEHAWARVGGTSYDLVLERSGGGFEATASACAITQRDLLEHAAFTTAYSSRSKVGCDGIPLDVGAVVLCLDRLCSDVASSLVGKCTQARTLAAARLLGALGGADVSRMGWGAVAGTKSHRLETYLGALASSPLVRAASTVMARGCVWWHKVSTALGRGWAYTLCGRALSVRG